MGTQHLTLLIKPASSLCNLRCRYCFYHGLAENRNVGSYGIMRTETAKILIEKAAEAAEKSISFAFQGGEPSLAGIEYFEYFVGYAKETISKSKKRLQANYSIQTNGMSMTESFAKFLRDNNFLVGLSLDGPKEINDFLRMDPVGGGTYGKITKTAQMFDKAKVDYNILAVITAQTARHIEKIYNHFKNRKFAYLQFIPCLEPLGTSSFEEIYSLTPELYEKFLIKLFELWHNDFIKGSYTSIRFFDNLVRIAAGQEPEQCGTQGFCAGQFVIEADGSVFPCDFYCTDNWKTGNILDMSFDEIYNSPKMQKFLETSLYGKYSAAEEKKCGSCKFHYLCRGGCRRDRDNETDGFAKGNVYCEALFNFYSFAEARLIGIAKNMMR